MQNRGFMTINRLKPWFCIAAVQVKIIERCFQIEYTYIESMTLPENKNMNNYVDFCVELSKWMIFSGANLERVQRTLVIICEKYELSDASVFLLSNYISMGAYLPDGSYVYRQATIPNADNNLHRLKELNRLCYTAAEKKKDLADLKQMLEEISRKDIYPQWLVNIAQIFAMACVCMMFGGGPGEVLCVMCIVAVLQQEMRLLSQPRIDQVIVNAMIMFSATALAYLFQSDFGVELPVLVITAIIMIVPGISMVNATRNLLCGNEINGFIQVLKITIETLALSFGIVLAMIAFRWDGSLQETVVKGSSSPALLITLSFAVSVLVGITFRIDPSDLWLAGLGGTLSRVTLILLTSVEKRPLVYTMIAAFICALYAEFLASKRKDPSTYFIYPTILPMIPGGSFYYSLMGLYASDPKMFRDNGVECILTLLGMSAGFVASSIAAHYARRMKHVHIERLQ